jgi:hypothetical protein
MSTRACTQTSSARPRGDAPNLTLEGALNDRTTARTSFARAPGVRAHAACAHGGSARPRGNDRNPALHVERTARRTRSLSRRRRRQAPVNPRGVRRARSAPRSDGPRRLLLTCKHVRTTDVDTCVHADELRTPTWDPLLTSRSENSTLARPMAYRPRGAVSREMQERTEKNGAREPR